MTSPEKELNRVGQFFTTQPRQLYKKIKQYVYIYIYIYYSYIIQKIIERYGGISKKQKIIKIQKGIEQYRNITKLENTPYTSVSLGIMAALVEIQVLCRPKSVAGNGPGPVVPRSTHRPTQSTQRKLNPDATPHKNPGKAPKQINPDVNTHASRHEAHKQTNLDVHTHINQGK